MSALLAGVSVLLGVLAIRRRTVIGSIDAYVLGETAGTPRPRRRLPEAVAAIVFGGGVGGLVVPGHIVPSIVIGAGAALVVQRVSRGAARRRAAARLGQELPAVADLMALYVLSGESIVGAIRRLCGEARGIAAAELQVILDELDAGEAFPEAAREAARRSVHVDGGRLYELLAQAHRSGARLVDALEMFATDRRAAIGRELAAEGGRRALAGYGPILGLMIPTTLVFLMYPTLAGLDALSSTR